ncbi:MAG: tetratricopeptide repeat protein [Vicingaceae bacterium]|nr:tetratricopeptide repeat protein [Vicingaceae bacterium]
MKLSLFISLFLGLPLLINAQTPKIDSLYNELNLTKDDASKAALYVALSDEFWYFAKDSLNYFIKLNNKALELVNKNLIEGSKNDEATFIKIKSDAFNNLAYAKQYQGLHDEAIRLMNTCLQLRERINNDSLIISSLIKVSSMYKVKGDLEQSIDFIFKALEKSESLKMHYYTFDIYNNIAILYSNLGENEKARQFWEKALKIANEINDTNKIANALHQLGYYYRWVLKIHFFHFDLKKIVEPIYQFS